MFHLCLAECARLHPLPSAAFTGCFLAAAHHRSCVLSVLFLKGRRAVMADDADRGHAGSRRSSGQCGGGRRLEPRGTDRSVGFYCVDKGGCNFAHLTNTDVS